MSDAMTNRIKSFTVTRDAQNRPRVTATHWQPGYTPAHHETKEAAVAYALQKAVNDSKDMKEYAENLSTMLQVLRTSQESINELKPDGAGVE